MNLPIIDEPTQIESVIDSQTECEFEPMLTSKIRYM